MVKVISKNNIKTSNVIINNENMCPFDDGDLVKHKDVIFLVRKCEDGYFCIQTDTIISMKKIKPDNWKKFIKI